MKYPDRNSEPAGDPFPQRCANSEFGQRCANLGSFSWSTMGGGPWLCRQHFFPTDPPYVFPRYESIAQLPHEAKKPDNKDWARRILHRKSLGESLPMLSIDAAREALGMQPLAKREPGSDDV